MNHKIIVCIGVSTGGPKSLEKMLMDFPQDFKAPILIVQHMPAKFTKSLADRLNRICNITVKEAVDKEKIQEGVVYIAPGDYHLKVKKIGATPSITLDQSEPKNGHRPSVDTMFESISKLKGYLKIAVILTGMGSDGTNGIKTIKESRPSIAIAESEKSAVIYGMPKSAIQTGQIDHVLGLTEIKDFVIDFLNNL